MPRNNQNILEVRSELQLSIEDATELAFDQVVEFKPKKNRKRKFVKKKKTKKSKKRKKNQENEHHLKSSNRQGI